MKRTKIICTLGPASSSEEVLTDMLRAGMNVARFNFSHGTHETHRKMIETFRRVRDGLGLPAAVMLDTRGPEIRTGELKNGPVKLCRGKTITLTAETVDGDAERVSVSYSELPQKLSPGASVLIDDGAISLKVLECRDTEIVCEVTGGGSLGSHKGVNLPGVRIDMPYLSEKDKADLIFGIEEKVDYISASFVRRADDVIAMRRFLDYHGGHSVKIIAKIENEEGVANFDEILEAADGIMVARGDMGVEIEFERLPGIQKRFIRRCYRAGKVVITATQMLESMITNASPTRAEITDVANAVFDGTSAVMLSGETAMGVDPARVVRVMARIAERAETDAFEMDAYRGIGHDPEASEVTNAICEAACVTAKDVGAKAIIAVTTSGYTARRMSKFRPEEFIVAATPVEITYHQLSLSWGVFPVLALYQHTSDELFRHAVDCARLTGLIDDGDKVVITGGAPLGETGNTNILKVEQLERRG